jgi:hypothetical protein
LNGISYGYRLGYLITAYNDVLIPVDHSHSRIKHFIGSCYFKALNAIHPAETFGALLKLMMALPSFISMDW